MPNPTLEQIEEAFTQTGLLPMQSVFSEWIIQDGQLRECGCPITALYRAKKPGLPSLSNSFVNNLSIVSKALHLTQRFLSGLISGWDGATEEDIENDGNAWYSDPRFQEGYILGQAAAACMHPMPLERHLVTNWWDDSWEMIHHDHHLLIFVEKQLVWSMEWMTKHYGENGWEEQQRRFVQTLTCARNHDLEGLVKIGGTRV